jgi:hypothetical protein
VSAPGLPAVSNPVESTSNDCYVDATATFLGVSFYEAYVLFHGGPPPGQDDHFDAKLPMDAVVDRLATIGVVPTDVDYMRLRRRDALVFVRWRTALQCQTLHAVVWDARKRRRVDGCGHDTTRMYGGTTVMTLVRGSIGRLELGIVTGLPRSSIDVQADKDREKTFAEAMRRGIEAARARVRDHTISLGA